MSQHSPQPSEPGSGPAASPQARDLRGWISRCNELGELRQLTGADWEVELGAITELCHHRPDNSPALLFDEIAGYPAGFRVLTNALNSTRRLAMTLSLESTGQRLEFVRRIRTLLEREEYISPQPVDDGPVLENVVEDSAIDMLSFPAPLWHELDGGRYIGTGSVTITQDPDDGWINLGTYRMMVHDSRRLGFYVSPGKQGRIMREKYFDRGRPCQVAVSLGHDPLFLCAGGMEIPYGLSEYDWIGGIQGAPVEVISGPLTGIPFPAAAEIVIEAEAYPDDLLEEGPFGSWTGYYSSSPRPEPVLHVKRLYHRNDPILLGAPPGRPPCEFNYMRCFVRSAMIWRELEQAGIPDIRGVWCHEAGGSRLFTVVALKQRYAGHAQQAGMVAAYCQSGGYMGRYCVVVDDDIDPADTDAVLWAMCTRSDPHRDIETIRNSWSGPLDPILPRSGYRQLSSRAIINACRPYQWMDSFPAVAESSPEVRRRVREKWEKKIFDGD